MLPFRRVAALAFLIAAGALAACGDRPARSAAPPPASTPASAARVAPAQSGAALVAYLRGAEIQAETDAQRDVLRRALHDLASLPPAELRAARYPSSDGRPGQRDVVQVLRGHLVPARPQGLDLDELLAGRESEAGRSALRETLAKLGPPAAK